MNITPTKREIRDLIKRGCQDMDLDDFLSWEIYKDFLRRVSRRDKKGIRGYFSGEISGFFSRGLTEEELNEWLQTGNLPKGVTVI